MAFDSQVRCDIETLDVTINNYERMENAPEAWSRIKKLVEEKLTPTNNQMDAISLVNDMFSALKRDSVIDKYSIYYPLMEKIAKQHH